MPRVQIYCYGCSSTVSVATARSADDLSRAGWSLVKGETYCSRCGDAHAPLQDASAGGGGGERENENENENAASQHGATVSSEAGPPRSEHDSGVAASALAKLRSSRFARTRQDGAERPAAPFRPTGAALLTTLRLPFRRAPVPITSHSKLSAQTIVLFCIAAVLILVTLGSNSLIVRLPGVVCSVAAGVSWLRDLRSSS